MSNAAQQQQRQQPPADGVDWDENTFFLVVDEGDEDGRLRAEVDKRCRGVNPGKVVTVLPLMNLSERHSLIMVYRPHVRGERDMKMWPIRFSKPIKAADFWSDTAGLNLKKFKNACGAECVPATPRFKDEPGLGDTMRLHYA